MFFYARQRPNILYFQHGIGQERLSLRFRRAEAENGNDAGRPRCVQAGQAPRQIE